MGGKAQRIRHNVAAYLASKEERNEELEKIYFMMKGLLVHDLSEAKFADMYAQTLVYGLFVARYGDESPENFSRKEARDLVPASNPFLREFFDHIVGPRFDQRLSYIVDELCEVFKVSDVKDIVHKHLKVMEDGQDEKDPIIHFYEDFLKEYDADERKKMGAYYTPIPVVRFIIRSVDKILKEEFGLAKGLADTSKKKVEVWQQGVKKMVEMHKVQILDPAVGTATFLNEIIKFIYQGFRGQEGRWPSYAAADLVPRLHGFELMMAPYTIAHLKLGMTLQETGLKHLDGRLGVYLTNTLTEGVTAKTDLFNFGLAETVSKEAQEAAKIKNERPIMVVIGNPPYSGISSNETEFANKLIAKYKVEPGGLEKLKERKHWLNDDYVKFIAFAEEMIEKNSEGIVAMITNHGYLDNPTFRGMRWHLAKTFDKIYVLDLHGNAKKKEVSPDGSRDENVFTIMQGVSIILGVKTNKKNQTELADIYHTELYGKRESKFKLLENEAEWKKIVRDEKYLFFSPKNIEGKDEYEAFICLDELMPQNVTGIVTMGDSFIVAEDSKLISDRVQKLIRGGYDENSLNIEFGLGKNYAKFVLDNRAKIEYDEAKLAKLSYRPFDDRWTYFDNKVVWRWRENIMRHFLAGENIGLIASGQNRQASLGYFFMSKILTDFHILDSAADSTSVFPLYLYSDTGDEKIANFNPEKIKEFTVNLKKPWTPENVLDYIYAVLHSPTYREKYKEFLKIDFPRVPTPKDDKEFFALAGLGEQIRGLHLLTPSRVNDLITTFPKEGSDEVVKVEYKESKVFINPEQFFGNVPEVAWSFYIGGYQPAQKWLKDRKGRKLSSDDIDHYQQMIVALTETDRLMKEIDKVWQV